MSGAPSSRDRGVRRPVLMTCPALLAVLFSSTLAPRAQALESGISSTPSSTRPYYACPSRACLAIIDPQPVETSAGWELPAGGPLLEGSGEKGGYSPNDIQSAYRIPATGGYETVAVVDANGAPGAERGLATYRKRYGLAPCTKANGCFKKVNQKGEEGNYPKVGGELEWGFETSLDLDMVSAACPNCHILLVQANKESSADLGASVNTAVRLGATQVSNSYHFTENNTSQCGTTGCSQYRSDYEHAGIPITAGGGDEGYNGKTGGDSFPAVLPGIIAVGGTNLYRSSNARGWREDAWEETGSGCSAFEPKPPFQKDTGCGGNRTTNDVAAVAGCKTPVSVFIQVLETQGEWTNACGTSVATPIIAGIEAHVSPYTQTLGPEAFYRDPEALFDIRSGSNGTCTPAYLCTAGVGYDGPTGTGTPDGLPYVHPPY